MTNFKHTSDAAVAASTWLHEGAESPRTARRLDPRVSLSILVLLNLIAFAPTNRLVEISAVVACAAVMGWCGRRAAMLRWLAAYAVIFAAGYAIVQFPNDVTASFAAMIITFRRVFCVGMFASNMIATTRVGEMASALQRIRVPRGMICGLCVALRFFPTMGKEFVSVVEAMKVRGFALTPASILRRPAATVENLLIPVMSRFAIVADELSNAAIVRGIDSDEPRTSYYDLRFSGIDAVFLLLFCAIAASVALAKTGVVA